MFFEIHLKLIPEEQLINLIHSMCSEITFTIITASSRDQWVKTVVDNTINFHISFCSQHSSYLMPQLIAGISIGDD